MDIQLPRDFRASNCVGPYALPASFVQSRSLPIGDPVDFQLTPPSSFRPHTPLSRQFGPCGVRGRGVILSANLSAHSIQETMTQWLNDRFGLFLESLDDFDRSSNHSRQHLFCQGRSARQIWQNQTSSWVSPSFVPPSMVFGQSPPRRAYILVVQRSFPSSKTALSQPLHWESLQGALLPLIMALPADEGHQIAIVSYDQREAQLNLPLTKLSRDNRVILHSAIPRRPTVNRPQSEEACHSCALDLIENLRLEPEVEPHLLWVVRSGQWSLPSADLPPRTAIVALNRHLHRSWATLKAPVYALGPCSEDTECRRELLANLLEALPDRQGQMVERQPQAVGRLSGHLEVDGSLQSLTAVVSTQQERDIAWLRLTSPSGKPHVFPLYSHGMAILTVHAEEMEVGLWQYEAQMYDETASFSFDLLARQKRTDEGNLQGWSTTTLNKAGYPTIQIYGYSNLSPPSLQVEVYRPGHRQRELPPVQVDLLDEGTGYPDVKSGDGIYSAYFVDLSPEEGFYHLSLKAVDDQGRPRRKLIPSFHVSRLDSSFYWRQEEGSRLLVSDVFPPNRITDLGIVPGEPEEDEGLLVTLHWTAPSGDFNVGNTPAYRYEIRCATRPEALFEESYQQRSIPVHTSLVPIPLPPGSEQRCTVGVPWHGQDFYYAVLAIDAAGNRGLISNTVTISISAPSSTPIPKVTSTLLPSIARPRKTIGFSPWVIAGPLLGLISMTLLGVILWAVYRRGGWATKEYVCDDKETNTTGVSTDTDGWSSGREDLSSLASFEGRLPADCMVGIVEDLVAEPRIHIMEDFSVYRDLSTRSSEMPADYLKLDALLSAYLSGRRTEAAAPLSDPVESLV